jgi:gliding motility-associated-like protein
VYTVTLIAFDPEACNLADTASQQVVVLGNTAYQLPDTAICPGELVQIGIPPLPSPDVTYQWSPATGLSNVAVANPFASPTTTTTYTLLVSNGACTDTVTQVVNVGQGNVDAGPDLAVCGPFPVVVLTATGDGGVQLFHWSTNAQFTDTLNNPLTDSTATVFPQQPVSWFHVQALGDACALPDSMQVTVELLDPQLLGDTLICSEDPAQLLLLGSDAGSNILWLPESDIVAGQGTTEATVQPVETTAYGVEVESPAGCTWSGTITVQVSPIVGPAVTASVDQPIVTAGTTVQLGATPQSGVTYSWEPAGLVSDPTSGAPTATVTTTTTFTVTVSDGICTKDASVEVTVYELICEEPDIFVPNTFTPNGDGVNDVLFVRGRHITDLEFMVFDRWGEKVFETRDQNVGWDGTFRGQAVDPAVFVYHLTAWCADGQRYFTKGNVTVIR